MKLFGNDEFYTRVQNYQSQTDIIRISEEVSYKDAKSDITTQILYDDNQKCVSTYNNIFNLRVEDDKFISSFDDLTSNIPNGCFYNLIISALLESFSKKYKKNKLDVKFIKKVCGITRDGFGMSIEEAEIFCEARSIRGFNELANLWVAFEHIELTSIA